jgi:hypothetical protein
MNSDSTFKVYFPFELHGTHKFEGAPYSFELNGLKITISPQGYFQVLEIDGLQSESQAKDYFDQIPTAMIWAQLHSNIGIVMPTDLQEAIFPEVQNNSYNFFGVEIPFNGPTAFIEESRPVIVPSGIPLSKIILGRPSISVGCNAKPFVDYILDAISMSLDKQFLNNEKNRLAFELYNAFYFVNSNNSQLMSLIMVLETLSIPEQKHPVVLTLIEKWKDEVDKLKEAYNEKSEEYAALNSIRQELLFRKIKSIKSGVRSFVLNTLLSGKIPDAKDLTDKALNAYDKRSELVHKGSLPNDELEAAVNEVKQIVEMIFKILLQKCEI